MIDPIKIQERVEKTYRFNPNGLAFNYFDHTEIDEINEYLTKMFKQNKIVYSNLDTGTDGFNFFAVDKELTSEQLSMLNKTTAGNWVIQKDLFSNDEF